MAGSYAALITTNSDPHYGGSSEAVTVFDLNTGQSDQRRGGQSEDCADYEYGCNSTMDSLVLNSQGFTAVLSGLTLTGDILSWGRSGTPKTTQLS